MEDKLQGMMSHPSMAGVMMGTRTWMKCICGFRFTNGRSQHCDDCKKPRPANPEVCIWGCGQNVDEEDPAAIYLIEQDVVLEPTRNGVMLVMNNGSRLEIRWRGNTLDSIGKTRCMYNDKGVCIEKRTFLSIS